MLLRVACFSCDTTRIVLHGRCKNEMNSGSCSRENGLLVTTNFQGRHAQVWDLPPERSLVQNLTSRAMFLS